MVAHGDILRYIVDGHHSSRVSSRVMANGRVLVPPAFHEVPLTLQRWRNAEVFEFGFQAGFEDPEARLVERRSTHDTKPAVIQTPTPPTSEGSKSPGPMFAMSP